MKIVLLAGGGVTTTIGGLIFFPTLLFIIVAIMVTTGITLFVCQRTDTDIPLLDRGIYSLVASVGLSILVAMATPHAPHLQLNPIALIIWLLSSVVGSFIGGAITEYYQTAS